VPTPEGGTHEAGFWAAILKGVRAYGELSATRRRGQDHPRRPDRRLRAGLLLHREPEFVGQTKDRLATTEAAKMVEGAVRDHFDNWLAAGHQGRRRDPRFPRAARRGTAAAAAGEGDRAQIRHEEAAPARQAGRLLGATREGTELFIVEGDSAGGSAKMARDRKTQALLPLGARSSTCWARPRRKLGQNAEISDLCQALGVGMGTKFNIEDLRYDKVIIMTDADVDGAHIASLLMTFFFTQMRP
jgi:topoisomerase-4 subunit B